MTDMLASAPTRSEPPRLPRLTLILITFAACWAAGAVALDLTGLNAQRRDEPHLAIVIGVLLPSVLYLLGLSASDSVRSWTRTLDPAILILPHTWRMVGFSFVALWAYGVLPAEFAFAAGLGDAAIAVAAPLVIVAFWRGWRGAVPGAIALHVLGMVDFFFAILLGASGAGVPLAQMSQMDPMTVFPMSWIPTGAVPLLLLAHVIALANLALKRRP